MPERAWVDWWESLLKGLDRQKVRWVRMRREDYERLMCYWDGTSRRLPPPYGAVFFRGVRLLVREC